MSDLARHRDMAECEKEADGRVPWNGACACGWTGQKHYGSQSADRAHMDYRDHVEDVLGEMAYYEAPTKCLNCAYRGPAKLLVGTDVWAGTCPMCAASGRLRPDNEFLEDEREHSRSMRW